MNDDIGEILRDRARRGRGHAPFDVDAVLVRGRRRRRHRNAGVAGLSCLAAVAVVSTGIALSSGQPPGAGSAVTDEPSVSGGGDERDGLGEGEVARRCEQQLARLTEYQHLSSGGQPWRLRFPLEGTDQEYEAGDVVLLGQGDDLRLGYSPVHCRIPDRGEESAEVSPASMVPGADDVEGIRQVCGAISGTSFDEYDVRVADAAADNLSALLESPDGDRLACNLQPFTYDTGADFVVHEDGKVRSPNRGDAQYAGDLVSQDSVVAMDVYYVGSAAKSAYAPGTGTIWRGAGVVSPEAGSIEFTTETGLVVETPVSDGEWASVFSDPERVPDAGWPSLQARVLTATGEVLWEGTIGGL